MTTSDPEFRLNSEVVFSLSRLGPILKRKPPTITNVVTSVMVGGLVNRTDRLRASMTATAAAELCSGESIDHSAAEAEAAGFLRDFLAGAASEATGVAPADATGVAPAEATGVAPAVASDEEAEAFVTT